MLEELLSNGKVIGVKQSRKAIRDGRAAKVFLARDADPAMIAPIAELCGAQSIPMDDKNGMAQLGRACGITVGASVVVLLKEQ